MNRLDRGSLRSFRIRSGEWELDREYWSGHSWQLGTAAFWEEIARSAPPSDSHRLGATLAEEVGACLLGGFGVRIDMATAAFHRLQQAGAFEPGSGATADDLLGLLSAPLGPWGFPGRYRFPRQKSLRVRAAMDELADLEEDLGDRALRDQLASISGLGLKTASWVVRNYRSSSEVAIIDVHIVRAGIGAGVFDPSWRVGRDYFLYEEAFLAWSGHGRVDAAHLDACIWGYLSRVGPAARDIFGVNRMEETPRPVWRTSSGRLPIYLEARSGA